jgi:hypothetical protein
MELCEIYVLRKAVQKNIRCIATVNKLWSCGMWQSVTAYLHNSEDRSGKIHCLQNLKGFVAGLLQMVFTYPNLISNSLPSAFFQIN